MRGRSLIQSVEEKWSLASLIKWDGSLGVAKLHQGASGDGATALSVKNRAVCDQVESCAAVITHFAAVVVTKTITMCQGAGWHHLDHHQPQHFGRTIGTTGPDSSGIHHLVGMH